MITRRVASIAVLISFVAGALTGTMLWKAWGPQPASPVVVPIENPKLPASARMALVAKCRMPVAYKNGQGLDLALDPFLAKVGRHFDYLELRRDDPMLFSNEDLALALFALACMIFEMDK